MEDEPHPPGAPSSVTRLRTGIPGFVSIMGGTSDTEKHVSTLTDTILLRYVEMGGGMQRGLLVLKMRGSAHDTSIRRFTIDGGGMHIHEPVSAISGILAGNPMRLDTGDAAQG